jgi:hypothetical protein
MGVKDDMIARDLVRNQSIWMDEVHKAVMGRLLSGSNPGNFKTILEEWANEP